MESYLWGCALPFSRVLVEEIQEAASKLLLQGSDTKPDEMLLPKSDQAQGQEIERKR